MADKAEYLQAIDDAILDADSLEKFINGSDSETVLTRLSAEYPTLQKALKELFENGGIAGRFKTLAELQLSPLADGDYALVADDTDDKNGIYIKQGGAWVKSKYDLLKRIKDLEGKISFGKTGLLEFRDKNDNIYAYIKEDGHLYLTDIDDSVQNVLAELEVRLEDYKKVADTGSNKNLAEFYDNQENIYAFFDKDSGLNLAGLNGTVQDKLTKANMDLRSTKRVLDARHRVQDKVVPYIMSLLSSGKPIAPIPMECTPLNWSLSDEALNTQVSDMVKIPIDTPYDPPGDGMVIHPTFMQFRDTWNGYEYLMGLTPYREAKSKWENPVIYGSNDLLNYDMLNNGLHLADKPDGFNYLTGETYNSDIFFCYDFYSGELLCGWREYGTAANGSGKLCTLKARRTKDLVAWGDVEVLWKGDTNYLVLSPSIVFNFDTGMFDLYTIEGISTRTYNKISRWTSPTLKNPVWSNNLQIDPKLPNFKPWHIDVRYVGDALMGVMHYPDYENAGQRDGNIWSCKSTDNGNSWTYANKPVLVGEFIKPYKASVMPVYDDNGKYRLEYIYVPNSQPMYLYSKSTQQLDY